MDNLDFNFYCSDCKRSREYRAENCFARYRILRFKKGEFIAFKGDKVKELYNLVEGSIEVNFILDNGLIMRSTKHLAPTAVGGVALFSKENCYMVDTVALEDCTLIAVRREDIEAQMGRCSDFLRSFIDYTASRVDVLARHLALLSQRGVGAKLAYYILMHSDGEHYKFDRSVGQLSEYLCLPRPSLSRAIAQLVATGVITYNRKAGRILDGAALRAKFD